MDMYLDMGELYDELGGLRDTEWLSPTDFDRREDLEDLDSEIGLDSVRYEHAVSEDHFTDYARDLAEDIGAIDRDAGWPLYHIDWEAAAESLKMDYYEFEFDGKTWLVRA